MTAAANNRRDSLSALLNIALCLLGVLFALAGCKSKELSAEECRLIIDRELELKSSLLEADSPDMVEAKGSADRAVTKCLSGQPYSRKDLECIASAKTELEMSRCMAQAHEKR